MGVFSPSLTTIALLFGTGIAVDSIVTYNMYRKFLQESNGMLWLFEIIDLANEENWYQIELLTHEFMQKPIDMVVKYLIRT